jgi:hypothetical protein
MAHRACDYLGRSMDQHPRLVERHSRFNYRRLLHHARLPCLVSRECAAITHIPWQPFASEHARGLGGLAVGISIALWNYIGGIIRRLCRAK